MNMFQKSASYCFFLAVLWALTVPLQGQTGRVLGTVMDETEAVLPGATVTLTNAATGVARVFVTNATGNYEFPGLAPGAYTIRTEMPGFMAVTAEVQVQVAGTVRQDIELPVGEITETVNVSAVGVMLQTDNSEIGEVIENREVVELPLNGRDYTQLVTLVPGVISRGPGLSLFGGGTVSVNGARPGNENYLIEGVSTQASNTRGPQIFPSIEAIQEFKVQTNSFSAEHGRGTAIINVTTRSGTNDFHGNLYDFWRNDDFAANDFFQNQLDNPDDASASLNRHQFGGTLGGPIWKNRTFFFVNYEGERLREGATRTFRVPTQLEKQGDFSQSPGVNQILDPLTREPFAGKVIPAERFHKSYLYFRDWWPTPNAPGDLFISAPKTISDTDQFSARVDHHFSQSDSVFVRLFFASRESDNPGVGTQPGLLEGAVETVDNHQIVAHWTHLFSPSLISDFQYSRVFHDGVGAVGPNCFADDGCTNHVTAAGIEGMEFGSNLFPGAPQFAFGGGGWAQIAGTRDPIALTYPTDSWKADLTWIKGRHTFKGGIDFYQQDLETRLALFSRGIFTMVGLESSQGRIPWSDFVLGHATAATRAIPTTLTGIDYRNFHYYFQDDWKVTPQLTLNLGIRYEYNLFPSAIAGGAAVDPATGRLIFADLDGDGSPAGEARFAPGYEIILPLVQDALVSSTELGLAPSMVNTDKNNWAPRVGLAWRPFGGRTVIRAGYGIYYLHIANGNIGENLITTPPFSLRQRGRRGPIDTAFGPVEELNRITPGDWSAFALDPNQEWPYEQQFTFSIQQSLTNDLLFETAYIGRTSTHLISRDRLTLPSTRPAFVRDQVTLHTASSTANYHSWQTRLEKRYTSGLAFSANYTWSRSFDLSSEDRDTGGPFNKYGPSDFDIPHRFVFNSVWDLPFGQGRQYLTDPSGFVDAVLGGWQLSVITQFQSGYPYHPIVAGGNSTNPRVPFATIPDRICGGDLGNPTPSRWFDTECFVPHAKPADPDNPGLFLDDEGNTGRNILRSDGLANWDLGIMKNFYLGSERYRLQFRAEMFNAFNHAQFSVPGQNRPSFGRSRTGNNPAVGSANAARILATNSNPRQVQFALKLFF